MFSRSRASSEHDQKHQVHRVRQISLVRQPLQHFDNEQTAGLRYRPSAIVKDVDCVFVREVEKKTLERIDIAARKDVLKDINVNERAARKRPTAPRPCCI